MINAKSFVCNTKSERNSLCSYTEINLIPLTLNWPRTWPHQLQKYYSTNMLHEVLGPFPQIDLKVHPLCPKIIYFWLNIFKVHTNCSYLLCNRNLLTLMSTWILLPGDARNYISVYISESFHCVGSRK